MFDSQAFVGEDVRFKSSLCRKGASHSLHRIFQYMALGYSPKRMREFEPDLLPETVAEARSILVGRSADFFDGAACDTRPKDLKVLIDENVSPAVAGFLKTHFRKVSHVHDVGLTGKKDGRVWEWALDNGYHMIFTHDKVRRTEKDLTFIATQDARRILRAMDDHGHGNLSLSDLPLIVHLPGNGNSEVEIKKLLRQNKEKLLNFLSDRAVTYIAVKNGDIKPGPTYFELRGENYVEDMNITHLAVQRRKESPEFFKALWLGRLSAGELRAMTVEREAGVDRQIGDYFARPKNPRRLEFAADLAAA